MTSKKGEHMSKNDKALLREAILGFMHGLDRPTTAQGIYRQVSSETDSSESTTYITLFELVECGVIARHKQHPHSGKDTYTLLEVTP